MILTDGLLITQFSVKFIISQGYVYSNIAVVRCVTSPHNLEANLLVDKVSDTFIYIISINFEYLS